MPHFGGTTEKCNVCDKTVYLAEKIVVEDKEQRKTFHKTCLKCTHCKATLSLGNYASMNGVMYCKPHFKQLFATKGNYDEGFGKEKLTSKWSPNPSSPSPSGGSFVPVDKQEDPKSVEKKETSAAIASKFSKGTEKCDKCEKTVYATERIVIEEKDSRKVYHKPCLRCTHCQVILTLGSYAAMNGVTYCKPHLKQLFATKGNYDEGFGGEKHTSKWGAQAPTSPASFVPVEKNDIQKDNATSSPSSVANKFKSMSTSDKCAACNKTVYLTEKVVVEDKEDKKIFHKACLRCSHCQVVLSLGNYASMNGVMYCKPHFKQLFATKGNYDEGFGKQKHSAKWIEEEDKGAEEETKEPKHEESKHDEPKHEEHKHEEPKHEEHKHEEPKHEEPEERHDERDSHEPEQHEHSREHSHDDHSHDTEHSHEHTHEHKHEESAPYEPQEQQDEVEH